MIWCWMQGSNLRPSDYKSVALPTELIQQISQQVRQFLSSGGGRSGQRTYARGVDFPFSSSKIVFHVTGGLET